MSFMEHAFNEMKAIEPSITSDQFSTNWLNKCSSYYRSYKVTDRDMTIHALMCFIQNLTTKSSALRMNNDDPFLHQKAEQYELIKLKTNKQIRKLISTR